MGVQVTLWLLWAVSTAAVPAMVFPSLRVTLKVAVETLAGSTGSWKRNLILDSVWATFTAPDAGVELKITFDPAAGPSGPGPAVNEY